MLPYFKKVGCLSDLSVEGLFTGAKSENYTPMSDKIISTAYYIDYDPALMASEDQ